MKEKLLELKKKITEIVELKQQMNDDNGEVIYDLIFTYHKDYIKPLLNDLGIDFTYSDPDTTYEEDTSALVNALIELKDNLPIL